MDIFAQHGARPMEIGKESAAFDDANFYYEIELPGQRALAYLDENGTFLQDENGVDISARWLELAELHKAVHGPCILDGVAAVIKGGLPDEDELQGRKDLLPEEAAAAAKRAPACFYAFDILLYGGEAVTERRLEERKDLLYKAVYREGPDLELVRHFHREGLALMELALVQGYKSIVAKWLPGPYSVGGKSDDWIRCRG